LGVCFFINKSINPSPCSGDFPGPDFGYLWLISSVEGARDIIIHNIYRPQGTSSFISNLAHNTYLCDFFSHAPDNYDVFPCLNHTLLNVSLDHDLLGYFNLHYPLLGGAQATADSIAMK
jgi:hypothetical protein